MNAIKPRIVFFDLETLPNLHEALKVWPQLSAYPGLTLKATITSVICAGYKIYGEKKVHCINAWDNKTRWRKDVNDDSYVVKELYKILKSADVVVTHNGKRFDWKFLQTRLVAHGLKPLGKIHHVDTKQLAKQHLFAFNNRLGTIGQLLANDKKLENGGWELWVDVYYRKKSAMTLMERYCKQDVALLEKCFVALRPFINNLPPQNVLSNTVEKICPVCGSHKLVSNGWRTTKTKRYRRYQCQDCGTWSRTDHKDWRPRTL